VSFHSFGTSQSYAPPRVDTLTLDYRHYVSINSWCGGLKVVATTA